ncbi:MAG: FAD-dependent oxidoreductase [Gemmatimonadota bacterium]
MIRRDPEEQQEREHDLIVVGGGVYGCMVALESARRGLRPLLLERDDFGQHTSGSWLRILHGGLRYLQRLDMPRHVDSVQARRWFLCRFPDLVEPLRCVMPLYGRGLRRRRILAAALAADQVLSPYRNRGVRRDRRLPPGRTLTREALMGIAPSVRQDGLDGGALWYDAFTRRPQRLLMEVLRWAVAEGATALNYVEALRLDQQDGRTNGVGAIDRIKGRDLSFRAPVVVNCAGPWSAEVAAMLDERIPGLFRPSLAFNILLDREPDFEGALAVEAPGPDARTHFVYPAHGGILAGTAHAPVGDPSGSGPDADRVDAFRRELGEALPGLGLESAPVLHVFSGRLPVQDEGTVTLSSRPVIVHHGDRGGPKGLVSVSGVKFTTAPRVARQVLAGLERRGEVRLGPVSSDPRPEPLRVPETSALRDEDPDRIREWAHVLATTEAAANSDDILFRRAAWGIDPRGASMVRPLVDEVMSKAPSRAREAEP